MIWLWSIMNGNFQKEYDFQNKLHNIIFKRFLCTAINGSNFPSWACEPPRTMLFHLRKSRDRWAAGISPVQEREEPKPKIKSSPSYSRRDPGSLEMQECICVYLLGEGSAKRISGWPWNCMCNFQNSNLQSSSRNNNLGTYISFLLLCDKISQI